MIDALRISETELSQDSLGITCTRRRGDGGPPITQWVKPWRTDLVVPGLSSALGRDLFNCKQGSIARSLSLSPAHGTVITEILLKRT